MAVEKGTQTVEEKNAEAQDVKNRTALAADSILSSLNISDKKPETKEPDTKEPETKEPETKEPETEEPEMTAEDLLKTPDEELTEEGIKIKADLKKETEGNEDLIPKSKVEERFKQLTSKIKDLELKLESKETSSPKDSDYVKLENMSNTELKATKRSLKLQQAQEVDQGKLQDLIDLEMKVDDVLANAPTRFAKKQINLYDKAASELSQDPQLAGLDKEGVTQIKAIAENIYASYPKLKTMEEGQAMALKFAAEHFKGISKVNAGKSKMKDLKKFTSKLKKKVTLDNNGKVVNRGNKNLKILKANAHGSKSTSLDKAEYIKESPLFNIDSLVPDEFKNK